MRKVLIIIIILSLAAQLAYAQDGVCLRTPMASSRNKEAFKAAWAYEYLNQFARKELGEESYKSYLPVYTFIWSCFEIRRRRDEFLKDTQRPEIVNKLCAAETREDVFVIVKAILEQIEEKIGHIDIELRQAAKGNDKYLLCRTNTRNFYATIEPDFTIKRRREKSFLFRNFISWLPKTEKWLDELIDEKARTGNKTIDMAIFGIGRNGCDIYTLGAVIVRRLQIKGHDPTQWKISIDAFDINWQLFKQFREWDGEKTEDYIPEEYKNFFTKENIGLIKSWVETHLVNLNDPEQRKAISMQKWDITVAKNIAIHLKKCPYSDFRKLILGAARSFSILDAKKAIGEIEVVRTGHKARYFGTAGSSLDDGRGKAQPPVQAKRIGSPVAGAYTENEASNVPFVDIKNADIDRILEKITGDRKEQYRRAFQEYGEITNRLKALGIYAGFNKDLDFMSKFLRAALQRIKDGEHIKNISEIAYDIGMKLEDVRTSFNVIFQRWPKKDRYNVSIFLRCRNEVTGRKLVDDITEKELDKLSESLLPFIDRRMLISYVIHVELMKRLGINVCRTAAEDIVTIAIELAREKKYDKVEFRDLLDSRGTSNKKTIYDIRESPYTDIFASKEEDIAFKEAFLKIKSKLGFSEIELSRTLKPTTRGKVKKKKDIFTFEDFIAVLNKEEKEFFDNIWPLYNRIKDSMDALELPGLKDTFKDLVLSSENIRLTVTLTNKFDKFSAGKTIEENPENLTLMDLISYIKTMPLGEALVRADKQAADKQALEEKSTVKLPKAKKREPKKYKLTQKEIRRKVIDSAYNMIKEWIKAKDWEGAALAMWVIEKLDPDNPDLSEIKKAIDKEILLKSPKSKEFLSKEAKQKEIARLLRIIIPKLGLVIAPEINKKYLSILKELFCLRDSIAERYNKYISYYNSEPQFDCKVRWLSSIILSFREGTDRIVTPDVFKKWGMKTNVPSTERLNGKMGWLGSGQTEKIDDEEDEGQDSGDLFDVDRSPLVNKPRRAVGKSN